MVELTTERLTLRPVVEGDLDALVALREDPLVRRFFGETTREEVAEWVARSGPEWAERGYGRLAILDRESGAFLGRSGLRYWPEFDEVEVGWVLAAEARGSGIATEAALACLDWGFSDFDLSYITAMIAPDNTTSIAVARRLGMEPLREDTLRDFGVSVIVFALRREEMNTGAAGAESPG
jgi:RimJ/RimL family protein N-acetyltransferase